MEAKAVKLPSLIGILEVVHRKPLTRSPKAEIPLPPPPLSRQERVAFAKQQELRWVRTREQTSPQPKVLHWVQLLSHSTRGEEVEMLGAGRRCSPLLSPPSDQQLLKDGGLCLLCVLWISLPSARKGPAATRN